MHFRRNEPDQHFDRRREEGSIQEILQEERRTSIVLVNNNNIVVSFGKRSNSNEKRFQPDKCHQDRTQENTSEVIFISHFYIFSSL